MITRTLHRRTFLLPLLLFTAGSASAQAPRAVWTKTAHSGAVNAVAFSPDGRFLATAGADQRVKLWRSSDGALLKTIAQYFDEATSVVFSADSKRVVSGSLDDTFRITALDSGMTTCNGTLTGFVRDLALSPDQKTLALALGYFSNDLDLYDTATCQLASILKPHGGTIWTVAYSPEGSWLASGGADGRTVVMRASTSQVILNLGLHQDDVSGVAFTPDGKKVASCGQYDNQVLVWNVPSGALAMNLTTPGEFLHGLDISRDGRLIATCGEQYPVHGTIHIWKVADGSPVAQYGSSLGPNVLSIAFSPNVKQFAFGRSDGVLVLASTPERKIAVVN